MGKKLKSKVEKICDVCDKKFITSFSNRKRCSKECTDKYHNLEYIKFIWQYGITSKDYNEMFISQEGKCKTCQRHQSEFNKRLNIDHCHKTGKIRGLLCNQCNKALGLIRENVDTLQRMKEYVS